MHGNMDHTAKDTKDLIEGLKALFEFDILVPEWMSQEVKSHAAGTPLKKPIGSFVRLETESIGGGGGEGTRKVEIKDGKHEDLSYW
jgi:hypothetical protein